MKRRIREAYDSIQLSEASQERIWEDIMDRQRKGYRTVMKQSKAKTWRAVPVALLLIAAIAVGGFFGIRALENRDIPAVTAEPTQDNGDQVHDCKDLVAYEDYEREYADVPDYVRDHVILYAQALYENWSQERWERVGLSMQLYRIKDQVKCGFALRDLNGDGFQDLLLYGGSQLCDILVVECWSELENPGKQVYTLLSYSYDQVQMTLCQDDIIMLTYPLKEGDEYITFNRLGKNEYDRATLQVIETVFTVDGTKWFAGSNYEDALEVSREEAENIKNSYKPEALETRQFFRLEGYVVNYQHQFEGVDERYLPLLMNYGQAMCEDWPLDRWEDAGLSGEVYQAYAENMTMGYMLVDMDGNGNEELLIFGDDQLYALYVLRDDQPSERLEWKMHHNSQRVSIELCVGQVVKVTQKDAMGATDISFYQVGKDGVGDISLVMVGNALKTQEGQWYAGPNAKDAVEVTEEEAQSLIGKYAVLDVDAKPMLNKIRIQ